MGEAPGYNGMVLRMQGADPDILTKTEPLLESSAVDSLEILSAAGDSLP